MSTDAWQNPGPGAGEPGPWSDPDVEASSTHALFDTDEGGLSLAARKALVVLLKKRFITPQSHPEEWRTLLSDVALIRPRLHDMFLGLNLDTDREVAFKYQVTPDAAARFPTLLHATEWSREETILLVYLRGLAQAAHSTGEARAFVDRVDMLEHVASIRPDHATNRVGDARRVSAAVEALVSAGLLVGRKDADRFEISRAIDAILPLEVLKQLLAWITHQPEQPVLEPDGLQELPGPPTDTDEVTP